MKYLLWKSRVSLFIEENYGYYDNWESWVVWRELFLANKSPADAAAEGYKTLTAKYA